MSPSKGWILLALVVAAPCTSQTPPASAAAPPDSMPPGTRGTAVSPPRSDYPRGRFSGLMFGDLYYNVSGDPNHVYTADGADQGKTYIDATPTPIARDLNGIQLRRVWVQLDNDLSSRYTTRFRLEVDSKSLTSDGKIGVNVKSAYLQAKA